MFLNYRKSLLHPDDLVKYSHKSSVGIEGRGEVESLGFILNYRMQIMDRLLVLCDSPAVSLHSY